ncbi:MAG TPA: four helix bundle protein [Gemmatimonadaceae bacterium]|nr:four helix bundle protein [Gemmatimonadaceae bacterium]
MSDFKKLDVWRKGHALVLNVHRTTARMRKGEVAALRGQMMRAAMSIPTNIVEGNGQEGPKEFARFIRFSLNSSSELEYHLILARDLKAISTTDFDSLSAQAIEVRRMLYGLRRTLVAAPKKRGRNGQDVVN